MRRKTIGAQEVWYTRARFEWRDAAGMTGQRVWLCHKCGYWPSADSWLPAKKCGNCGEQWQTTADDTSATPVTVKVTDYGYERVAIGKTPNGEVRGASRLAGEASSGEAATSTVVLAGTTGGKD